jgi:hypothetical protein
MKKEDIIDQKLFEACKLSEFYLKLIRNAKNGEDSPQQLAYAYKLKLNDIVDRYDRLLESTKQRAALKLTGLDKAGGSAATSSSVLNTTYDCRSPQLLANPLTHASSYTRLNKIPHSPSAQSNFTTARYNTSTPFKSCANTPIQSSSKFSTSAFNLSNLASGSSTLRGSRTRLFNPDTYRKPAVTSSRSTKLDQRIAALYIDEYYNNNDEDEDDTDDLDTTESDDHEIDEYEPPARTRHSEMLLNPKQHQAIEKSFSNLSKDSGMLVESYHSDYSNATVHKQHQNSSGFHNQSHTVDEASEANVSTEDESNLNSPYSSNASKDGFYDEYDEDHNANSRTQSPPSEANDEQHVVEEENEPIRELGVNKINFGSLRHEFMMKQQLKAQKSANLLITNRQNLINSKINERLASLKPTTLSLNGGQAKKQINLNNLNLSYEPQSILEDADKRFMSILPTQGANENVNELTTPAFSSSLSNYSSGNDLESGNSSSVDGPGSSLNSLESNPNANVSGGSNNSMFMSNYNSMMNVSMLDNIQIANTLMCPEFDNMNSSILMFN